MDIDRALIATAVTRLQRGELVAFPTETVYGLGADATNLRAVTALFVQKKRPPQHPVIVHIAAPRDLSIWARSITTAAAQLAAEFWPGPLTLIVDRAWHVLDHVTGGQDSVALRCPAHPLAQALLSACREAGITGLAAPSANRYGHLSPTQARHVVTEFGSELLVLDGGPCAIGIESTIADVRDRYPRVLRPGAISEDMLVAACATSVAHRSPTVSPRVPGSQALHYAPQTPLYVLSLSACHERARRATARGRRLGIVAQAPLAATTTRFSNRVLVRSLPREAAAYARGLYATLRELDAHHLDEILLERPPTTAQWCAIQDRLQRAARSRPLRD